jgi:undecaprenyl-diphosphatase
MLFSVILLSLIEGITEFLPISSTGHLLLVSPYLPLDPAFYTVFDIAIQLGAILAVPTIFPHVFLEALRRPFQSSNYPIIAATLPIVVVGFLTKDFIKSTLFNSTVIFWGLIVGGIGLIIMDRRPDPPSKTDRVTLRQSVIIGLWQCLALWPGMSRSAVTIMGGMAAGCTRQQATFFSFIIAVPLLIGVVMADLLGSSQTLSLVEWGWLGLGIGLTYGGCVITIRWFLAWVNRRRLTAFGVYRIAIGLLGILLI